MTLSDKNLRHGVAAASLHHFGTLFAFGLLSLLVNIISDLMYVLIDPRIDFNTRES